MQKDIKIKLITVSDGINHGQLKKFHIHIHIYMNKHTNTVFVKLLH